MSESKEIANTRIKLLMTKYYTTIRNFLFAIKFENSRLVVNSNNVKQWTLYDKPKVRGLLIYKEREK